jgi:hypothetical protein
MGDALFSPLLYLELQLAHILPDIFIFARGNFLIGSGKILELEQKIMRINGLIQTTEILHQRLFTLACQASQAGDLSSAHLEVEKIHKDLTQIARRVERLCLKHQANPADLPNPSFRAYQWFQFLGQKKWLLAHLHALREFHSLSSELIRSKNLIAPKLEIRITHSSYLYRVNQERRQIIFEINEGFLSAPQEMKQYVVQAALNKKNRQYSKKIRAFSKTPEYIQVNNALNSSNQANHRTFMGKHYDLQGLFNDLNQEYFQGKLEQPRIMWSARSSKRRLGTYDPHSNTITINRRFDRADTPVLLIKYILYHEMLHQYLGIKEVNGRRYAHTSTFKKAESKFKDQKAAEELVKSLN